jgi:multidrug efflux pump subunit AcrA (membrane-fusion protein)
VFVEGSTGKFERRQIRTGASDDRHVEIVAGVKEGERIVTRGTQELQSHYRAVR